MTRPPDILDESGLLCIISVCVRSSPRFYRSTLLETAKALGTETVLLVEDDTGVRAVAHKALLGFGYTVLSAEGGEDALRLARDYQGRIDLLLTDIMMPGMNGLEVAARVTRFRPAIRIFFMSGYADQDLARQGLLDPDTHLLNKPFSPRELGERVREVLDLPARA